MIKTLKKINYKHYIAISITICFLLTTLFYFGSSGTRILESCKDFGLSIAYYVQEIFNFDWNITPSVNSKSQVPFTPFFNLPATYEEFVVVWKNFWNLFFSKENLLLYFNQLGDVIYYLSKFLMLFGLPIVLIFVMLFRHYITKQNNDYNKDSKMLSLHKRITASVYTPIKRWLFNYLQFIKQNKIYYQVWLFIWARNFNLITIFLEFLAFYFFFVVTFDISSIYLQVYKLFSDLSLPIAFIPPLAWVIIGYLILCKIRKNIGYARLEHHENMNCGFINERPIVMMLCGTMGKKKTTIITDIALSQDVMFKEKAFEKILENDLKFPHFPWINLENTLKKAMKKHLIYNLASIKKYIQHLHYCFNVGWCMPKYKKFVRRHLKKHYCCSFEDLCFNYDIDLYGYEYNDKLKITYLWDTIETYAQLYFIYVIQSSLIISNYSIRTDNLIEDLGNFPMWNTDFFKKDSRLIDSFSRHSHIIDFDVLRLGKKLVKDNKNKDMFEFGVINLTEIGKERKNTLELRETKKSEDITNQKNDGFNDWLKMVRHSATVDMFPFVKVITDEQRPESWGADARDLLEIVHIRSASDFKLLMPFFTITELLYMFIFSKFQNLYYQYRFNRSDNTLFMHLLKSLSAKFNHYVTGIHNTFGCCTCNLQVENGTQDGNLEDRKYYLMSKKIYSKRFSTDCFSDFFTQKALKSEIGIEDLEEYGTEKATFKELEKQNSYFMNDLMNKKENDN